MYNQLNFYRMKKKLENIFFDSEIYFSEVKSRLHLIQRYYLNPRESLSRKGV